MKAEEFERTSIAYLGSPMGWQSRIADALGVNPRTVRRWIAAGQTPDGVDMDLARLIGASELKSPFPRDEWLLGDALGHDGRRREYLVHLQYPRFVARLVECDDDGAPIGSERPADILTGVVYASGDQLLCEIAWIDEPEPGVIAHWLEAAFDYVERVDAAD